MDWIKVKTNHILLEYTDLRDSEFVAWIKIMALTARLDHIPTNKQMLNVCHHKTLKSLQDKLINHSTTLQEVLKKVSRDAQEVSMRREAAKLKKRAQREHNRFNDNDSDNNTKNTPSNNVPRDVPPLDKIRIKSKYNIENLHHSHNGDDDNVASGLEGRIKRMSSSYFLEVFKDENFIANPFEYCQRNASFCYKIAELKADSKKGLDNRDAYIGKLSWGLSGNYSELEIMSLIKQGHNLAEKCIVEKREAEILITSKNSTDDENTRRSDERSARSEVWNSISQEEKDRYLRFALEHVKKDSPNLKWSADSLHVKETAKVLVGRADASQ